jgi:hypothetical protein
VSEPEIEVTMKALESARAEASQRRSELESARTALGKAEEEAKNLIDAAKIEAQSITEPLRAHVDKATRNLEQSESMVRSQEEYLFIALEIIKVRIGKSLGHDPFDLSKDPIE